MSYSISVAAHPSRSFLPYVILFGVLLCSVAGGCSNYLPRQTGPEHIYTQQLRATYHDPYANVDAGPMTEGLRPEEYPRPRAAPVQSQWFN